MRRIAAVTVGVTALLYAIATPASADTSIEVSSRPIIFNVNINQNIIFNGDNGYVCIRVPNGNGGSYRMCGPRDNLRDLTPEARFSP
ncbi:hypothetical protein [Streptomyces syringium]|uniref:hypothetical protein n=1 Tax=Streptomyces syringium TaxID=76729 RepID=UPI00341DF0ED